MTRTPARPFRSRDWFDAPGRSDMTALYLERYMNYGLTPDELRCGKPIIGISQSGSDLVPCNRIHLQLVERVKAGIRDAGGIPMEFPMHPIFENCRRPTAALDRNLAYLGLYALQHRGQESAGIAASDGVGLHVEKAMGWVSDVFGPERLRRLPGRLAIGHVRYSTAGSSTLRNAQPISASFAHGPIALAHNGNLVNADALRKELEAAGAIFQSTSDSEVVLHLLARADRLPLPRVLPHALAQVTGAYSLLMLTPEALIGCRDPHGFRPLVIGRLGETWVLASETCALDLLEAQYVRDVEPGEIVVIDRQGLRSIKPFPVKRQLQCIFEYVYFARPDTTLWGQNVYHVRKAMGRRLAEEHPADADIVVPVPDSGVGAALGYAERSGTPFEMGLITWV